MNKINSNVQRDKRNDNLSVKKRWKVLRIRECSLKKENQLIIDDLKYILNSKLML